MPIDRQQKKKRKREEKRKDRRLRIERIKLHEKAEMHSYDAYEFFIHGDFDNALSSAIRALKVNVDDDGARKIAVQSATRLGKEAVLLQCLHQAYLKGALMEREELILLGELALSQRNLDLAEEIFHGLLDGRFAYAKPLTKVQIKTVERYLNNCILF